MHMPQKLRLSLI